MPMKHTHTKHSYTLSHTKRNQVYMAFVVIMVRTQMENEQGNNDNRQTERTIESSTRHTHSMRVEQQQK